MPVCSHCGFQFEGSRCTNCDTAEVDNPDVRPDPAWEPVYAGDPKWRLVVERALQEAGILCRSASEGGGGNYAARPDLVVRISVRSTEVDRAIEVLEALREKVPAAFHEG